MTGKNASAQLRRKPKNQFQERSLPASYFDADYVITRDPRGNPLSRYPDDAWDFSATSAARETSLSFYEAPTDSDITELDAVLREQGKGLIAQYLAGGAIRAFPTVYRVNRVCIKWCGFARACQKELFDVLCDTALVREFLRSLSAVDIYLSGSLISALWAGRARFGVTPQLTALRAILREVSESLPDNQQTPLIPSRVYSAMLGNLIGQMDVIERNLAIVLAVHSACRKLRIQVKDLKGRTERATVRRAALDKYKEKLTQLGYNSVEGGSIAAFAQGLMSRYQITLMYVVAAFTGMRIGECLKLPVKNVLSSVSHLGAVHWLINGFTHKLHHGIKRETSWVTNEEGRRAIEIALRISDAIHEGSGRPVGERLLFCSTENSCKLKGAAQVSDAQKWAAPLVCPVISQNDMDELEVVRLDRDWALDGIAVGNPWPLAFHQLRRSLAVYAHRSGMVSLPSLKAQLQHITEEMTLYYSSGFQDAANVVFEEEHFSKEWGASKAESSYFGMALGLLLNDQELLGAGANWLMSTRVKTSPVSAHSREHALELFKKGQLAFKDTALGGCTSTEPCKVSPLEPIQYQCLATDCPNLVVYGKRLDLVIRTQESVVATLVSCSPGSVEHRLEADNLETLLSARTRLKRAQS
ncbi:hypothetical protein G3A43_09435 [Paraburkholderia aspalathi]|nr:hypothetical protein [Paraburkholderia aspalathi]MBK3779822.1 hypothetical protein [Paraburkholderia aspalathi]MBK3780448.1 hypothetical protein [Paraburkholderia aspalathi]